MSKSISPISRDQSLKSNAKLIGMVSNLIFTVIQFILKHPILITTFGVVLQALLSSANNLSETPYPEANQHSNSNATLLHLAVETGNFPRVKTLTNRGFDIHAKDENGMTPIDLACEIVEEYSSIVEYFESKGARSFCGIFQSSKDEQPPIDEPDTQCLKLS